MKCNNALLARISADDFIILYFSSNLLVFMAQPGNMSYRRYSCYSISWYERRKLSQSQDKWKNKKFHVQNIMENFGDGELYGSTTCHYFDYRPLVIARFQKAVTSLVSARFWSISHLLCLNNSNFIILIKVTRYKGLVPFKPSHQLPF